MNVIVNINTQKFSLNGIQYLKNYISKVAGNRVMVFNCYDNKDVLIELDLYSNFTVNGTSYASAALLQAALLNVLYYRNTLIGETPEPIDQNNVERIIRPTSYSIPASINTTWIANYLNENHLGISPFTITETETPVLVIIRKIMTGGIESHVFEFLNGKGTWGGTTGTELTAQDFYKRPVVPVPATSIIDDPTTQTVNVTLEPGQDVSEWLNEQNPSILLQSQDDGYVVFDNGTTTYLFVGTPGTYGEEDLQSTMADFQVLDSNAGLPLQGNTFQVSRKIDGPVTSLSLPEIIGATDIMNIQAQNFTYTDPLGTIEGLLIDFETGDVSTTDPEILNGNVTFTILI